MRESIESASKEALMVELGQKLSRGFRAAVPHLVAHDWPLYHLDGIPKGPGDMANHSKPNVGLEGI